MNANPETVAMPNLEPYQEDSSELLAEVGLEDSYVQGLLERLVACREDPESAACHVA